MVNTATLSEGQKLRVPRVLKVGTDFSGLDSSLFALKRLKVSTDHVFSSDVDPACRALLEEEHKPRRLYEDVCLRSEEAEYVDLYITTPPCQPWSSAGQRQGLKDPQGRGKVLKHSLLYVKRRMPRAVVFENVKNLVSKKFMPVTRGIVRLLRQLGYVCHAKVLNSADFQVSQARKRFFLVAIRKDSYFRKFVWPRNTGHRKLAEDLDPMTAEDKPCRLPSGQRARSLAASACQRAWQQGVDPRKTPVAVDVDCSPKFASVGINVMKTLTRSRGATGGFWISNRGRKMTIRELMRVTGIDPAKELRSYKTAGVSEKQLGAMLGNSVPVPLIKGVLESVLRAGGLKRPAGQ